MNSSFQPLMEILKENLRQRVATRKAVTLAWFHKTAKVALADLELKGHTVEMRGQAFTGSRSWCYRTLLKSGFVSRRRTCKRGVPIEALPLGRVSC